ncbi:hypothetical protein BGZ63DRAFT_405443 [Mariannaea sp. PMI_226]|nr:hypothetical protein BGZ63DRAFT_405443 [Mariannaea sp. PMI_226]
MTARITIHHVVLVTLPRTGINSAAATTASPRPSYTSSRLAIPVGICGGIPRMAEMDEFVGDVIMSRIIIQYNYGRQYPGHLAIKNVIEDSLDRVNKGGHSLFILFQTDIMKERIQNEASKYLYRLQRQSREKRLRAGYRYSGIVNDRRYPLGYIHRYQASCGLCASD